MQNPRLYIDGRSVIKSNPSKFIKHFREYLESKGAFKEEDLSTKTLQHLSSMFRHSINFKMPRGGSWSKKKDAYFCKMLYMTDDISHENIASIFTSICRNSIRIDSNEDKRNSLLETRGLDYEHRLVIGNSLDKSFYQSSEWRAIRYQAFDLYGNMCQCCGRTPKDGIVLHVDHVMPRVLKPELALDITNLQILCELCNLGKRADYMTDWRR